MKKLARKLKSRTGETITEVLVALLISTFALLMLAMMIRSAQNSVTVSRKAIEKYYSDPGTEAAMTIKVEFKDNENKSVAKYSADTSAGATPKSKELGGKTVLSYEDLTLKKEGST